MNYFLHLRYVYSFFMNGELMQVTPVDQRVKLEGMVRFALEGAGTDTFTATLPTEQGGALQTVLTFPNKDGLVLVLSDECELAYEENYTDCADSLSNVYEGTVVLEAE